MHQAVVILDALLEQQLVADRAELPPGSDIARRAPAGKLAHQLDALVEHDFLLLGRNLDRVLVAVAVDADLVPGRGDSLHLLGEGLDRVAGDESGRLDAEALKQLQQARAADLAGEQAREMSSGLSSPP